MNIQESSRRYEEWLGKYLRLIPQDIALKHENMSGSVFAFFRATFYRWMQNWPETSPDLNKTPKILGVGDLHVENFGTWRDSDGRLVWGVNDFDEASEFPFALDVVRLAASAHLAIDAAHLKIEHRDACTAILEGYKAGLAAGGRPFVCAEEHNWLRTLVTGVLRDPVRFWEKFDSLAAVESKIPGNARKGLERMMPARGLKYRVVHRIAGVGSLGRQRFVAIAEYSGGRVAREAKALAPSAAAFASDQRVNEIGYQRMLDRAVRCADPFIRLKDNWIVRRLSPDCSRVELAQIPDQRDETKLLHAMGFETANVHLGTPKQIPAVHAALEKLPDNWLHDGAAEMKKAVTKDWEDWRKVHPRPVKKPAAKAKKKKTG